MKLDWMDLVFSQARNRGKKGKKEKEREREREREREKIMSICLVC